MELAQKFSELRYLSKDELNAFVDLASIEEVWQKMKEYRKQKAYPFVYKEKKTYLVMTGFLCKEMLCVNDLLTLYAKQRNQMPEERTLRFHEQKIVHLLKWGEKTYIRFQELIQEGSLVFEQQIRKQARDLLCDEMQPFLFRLYILSKQDPSEEREFYYLALCRWYGFISLYEWLDLEEFKSFYYKYQEEDDETYCFLLFLKHLRLKLSRSVLSLKGNLFLDMEQSLQTLKEWYPYLSEEQLSFYRHHHEHRHYYTVMQYKQDQNVCYETARSAMDRFVEMGWYKKQKIGKKFVYYVG